MSRETSTETGKRYGLERICRVLEFARSTLYAQQARESAKVVCLQRKRRGPKPKVSDADLLAAIRTDLEASPFTGEGHRKVWARLRIARNIRVSRARVLRLMRENALLSPHRRPQGEPAKPHTKGVAERFNRTVKEQAIYGRVFKNVEEVRVAVTEFKDRFNRRWRLEKLGFMSPLEAGQAYALRMAA